MVQFAHTCRTPGCLPPASSPGLSPSSCPLLLPFPPIVSSLPPISSYTNKPSSPSPETLSPFRRALALNPLLESAKAGLENLERLEKTHDADADGNLDGLTRSVPSTPPPSISTEIFLLLPIFFRHSCTVTSTPLHAPLPSVDPATFAHFFPAARHVLLGDDLMACARVICHAHVQAVTWAGNDETDDLEAFRTPSFHD